MCISTREMASSTALRRFFFHWVASAIEWCEDCRQGSFGHKSWHDQFAMACMHSTSCRDWTKDPTFLNLFTYLSWNCCASREPHRTGILAKIVKSNRFGGLCMTAPRTTAMCTVNRYVALSPDCEVEHQSLLTRLDLRCASRGDPAQLDRYLLPAPGQPFEHMC